MRIIDQIIDEMEAMSSIGISNFTEQQRNDYNDLVADARVLDPDGEYEYIEEHDVA